MSSSNSSMNEQRDSETQKQNSELTSRQNRETSSISTIAKGNDVLDYIQDQETRELYLRARSQQDEIMFLREQVALASVKESQLLNEKYTLEKKFSELRMALDEKQSEAISSASNELARRKIDLEENVKLIHELKVAEDEKYIFMSSMLGLLAEYGIWPRVANASTLTNSIKHLHDQLQLKIRNTHAGIAEINSMMGNHSSTRPYDKESPPHRGMNGQLGSNSTGIHGFSPYIEGTNSENNASVQRYGQNNHSDRRIVMLNPQGQNSDNLLRPPADTERDVANPIHFNFNDRSGVNLQSEERINDHFYDSPAAIDGFGPTGSEEGPRIDGFQIIGDARPGCRLLGCGYPVQGTSLCMFQWVRHYPDGTREYIEGATNPEYVVTADDVDKVIAVECIPMDDQGRQGELVRLFANDSNKITCDLDMQLEIDSYVSQGHATFDLLMLTDSSENWEPSTLILKRSSFQVKLNRTQAIILAEKFSKELSIIIPGGFSSQFVVTCSNGSSHPFSTNNDISVRDEVVLTMRIFQSKAVDEKRKGKA